MKPINPIVALAGAAVVFAAGYAWGAAGDTAADPFLNTKLLASNGPTFVEGPDAEPPPWPAGAQAPAARATLQPASATAAVATAPAAPPAPSAVTSIAAPPPETERVVPGAETGMAAGNAGDGTGDTDVAVNSIPSSALAPVYQPPAAPSDQRIISVAPRNGSRRVPRHGIQKQVTFGTMRGGQPVTIIWDSQ